MEHTAKAIRSVRRAESRAGIERLIQACGIWTWVIGAIGFVPLGFTIIATKNWWLLLLVPSYVLSVVTTGAVLLGFADMIRLRKKQMDLHYSGNISGTPVHAALPSGKPVEVMVCSECGFVLLSEICCDGCGARLIKDDPEDA